MYSNDGGKTWVKTDLGIEFDFFPQMICNSKEYRYWETLNDLKKILSNKSFVG